MRRVFISWCYKIELPGLQWFDQIPCLSVELCIPCGLCFVSWYYKINLSTIDEMWLHMALDIGIHQTKYYSILYAEFLLLLFRGYMYNDILLVFDKSYHDSTNNENSSQSIILFNVHSMLRDIEYGLGCRCIYYLIVLLRFHII